VERFVAVIRWYLAGWHHKPKVCFALPIGVSGLLIVAHSNYH
jgi:hypothetical protein